MEANSENQYKNEVETSLYSLVKSSRTLTIKVPTRSEGWAFFFSSFERVFASKNVLDKYKAEILLNLLGEKATNAITLKIN